MEYVDLNYEPKENELIAEYYLKPSGKMSAEEAAGNVAKESSIGTWTTISTMSPEISRELKPHVYSIDKKGEGAVVKIAYSQELFEK
ncbi:MAG: ribulose-bisphosphate carboxylase large subunit, partial [Candidatus Aenigmatarchaeota archaeon]